MTRTHIIVGSMSCDPGTGNGGRWHKDTRTDRPLELTEEPAQAKKTSVFRFSETACLKNEGGWTRHLRLTSGLHIDAQESTHTGTHTTPMPSGFVLKYYLSTDAQK